jgi:hypothetical protein
MSPEGDNQLWLIGMGYRSCSSSILAFTTALSDGSNWYDPSQFCCLNFPLTYLLQKSQCKAKHG